jgi:hypothetical protein
MPHVIAMLERAVAAEDAARRGADDASEEVPAKGDGVSLRQRVWPLLEMLRRCQAAGEVITWGT